jgi:Mce-associated membrane protein
MTSTDTAPDAVDEQPTRRGFSPFLVIALVLVVLSAVAAVWFGVSWFKASNDDDLSVAQMRDEVTRVGEQAILTFNTLDYRKIDEDLDRWLNASVGPLHEEVVSRRAASKQAIEQAKTVTSARVLKSAITELRDREGKATIIAAVRIDISADGKPAPAKFQRVQGALERTDTGWKLSGVGFVPFTPA